MEQGTRNKEQGLRALVAWQEADELASAVYRSLDKTPDRHRWLTGQVLRAAVSVPANIADGYGRGSLGDYLRFLDIARGSLAELEYYVHFLQREGLVPGPEAARLSTMREEAGRVLHGLWKSLKQKARQGGWDRGGFVRDEQEIYTLDAIAATEENSP